MKIAVWIIAICELLRALQNLWQMWMIHLDMKMRKETHEQIERAERWLRMEEAYERAKATEGDDRTDM